MGGREDGSGRGKSGDIWPKTRKGLFSFACLMNHIREFLDSIYMYLIDKEALEQRKLWLL